MDKRRADRPCEVWLRGEGDNTVGDGRRQMLKCAFFGLQESGVLCHAWTDCRQFGCVELKGSEVSVSVVRAVSNLTRLRRCFWHSNKAFPLPITDSYTSLCHKSSCVKAPRDTTIDRNNHFDHKQTYDLPKLTDPKPPYLFWALGDIIRLTSVGSIWLGGCFRQTDR
jgi:hypothetical protein